MLIGGSPVQPEELHQVVILAYATGQLFLVIISEAGLFITMRITADGKLDVVRYSNLNHGRLIIDDLLSRNYNLVGVFFMDLLATLEALDHIVNEFLCHGVFEMHSVVIRFNRDRINIDTLGCGGFVANIDGGIKVMLSHNLLAVGQLKLGIFVVRVEFNAFLEVFDGVLGFENSGIGNGAAEVCLEGYDWLEPPKRKSEGNFELVLP